MTGRPRAAAALALACGGCMPWLAGETAATLPPGDVALGAGVSLLAAPGEPGRPLPVPQVTAAMGVADGIDVAAAWAAPLTFQARGRFRILEPRPGRPGLALTAGAGVHGFPDALGIGHAVWTPYALAGAHASVDRAGAAPFGGVRAFVPFVLGDEPAATLWLAPHAGVELRRGRLRWAPELGLVVPAPRPADVQLLAGVSVRRISLP